MPIVLQDTEIYNFYLMTPEQVYLLVQSKIEYQQKLIDYQQQEAIKRREALQKKIVKNALKKQVKQKQLQETAQFYRTTLIEKQTESEKIMKALLKLININYEFQKIIYTTKAFYIVDFYLPDYNLIFEIDGEYHNDPIQKYKDKNRTFELKSLGYSNLYRYTNESVNKLTEQMLYNKIIAYKLNYKKKNKV